ncbi:hypothetical protein GCM10025767_13490 [Thalassotalea piscium]
MLNVLAIICGNIMAVIKNPEITKKTSTPTKPPEKALKPAWFNMTKATAIVLNPSISIL